jgi:putative redox protein
MLAKIRHPPKRVVAPEPFGENGEKAKKYCRRSLLYTEKEQVMAENVAVKLNLTDLAGMAFEGETPTGHKILLDAAEEIGGHNLGPRPAHALLVCLGGCTGMDVISILRKMRQPVTGYQIEVTGERAEENPKKYLRITVKHIITGGVAADKLAHAIELSDQTYCSVAATLRGVAEIITEYEIR